MKFDPSKLAQPVRPHFSGARPLTAEDLNAEQEYQRQKQWLHNRLLHGYGLVAGLEVMVQDDANGGAQVVVAPGYALDGWGRELIVPTQITLHLPGERRDLVIYLKYMEDDENRDLKKSMASGGGHDEGTEAVKLFGEPPPADRALAPTHRSDFAIPLARVRRPNHTWQRDPNFRPARTHS